VARRQLAGALASFGELVDTQINAAGSPGSEAEALATATARLDHLRGPGTRWGTVMSDGYGDLVNDVDYRFRARLRTALRNAEETIEVTDPKDGWDAVAGALRTEVAGAVRAAVDELVSGAEEVNGRVVEVLSGAGDVQSPETRGASMDALSLWRERPIELHAVRSAAGAGYAGLRGAQGGIVLLGVMTHLAGLALTTGATLGIGAVFGGKQLLEERKRQSANRRVQARGAVRQFVDDVQFEMGKGLRDLGRDLQRTARDSFGEQVTGANRSLTLTIQQLGDVTRRSAGEQQARLTTLQQHLALCRQLQHMLAGLDSAS
jgi:hypothetical protein